MELGSLEIIIIILAITVGAVVHGTLGIGFPLVATPVIALVTDVRIAIIILLIPTMAVNIASILNGGRFIDVIKRFWFILIFIGIGSYAGTSLLVLVDPNPFRLLLALVILFYLFTRNTQSFEWSFIRDHPTASGIVVGTAAGVLAGTVNITMPPLIIYFSEMRLSTVRIIQILNVCFFVGKITQAGTFIARGAITAEHVLVSLPLSIIAIIVLRYGIGIRNRIDGETYRRWLMGALSVIALLLVIQFIMGR
jgi:uncharacterized protein